MADAFRDCFRRSGLDRLKAVDLERPFIDAGRVNNAEIGGDEKAKRHIALLLARAGGLTSWGGSCLWAVLGVELPLGQWAQTRQIPEAIAAGVLLGALSAIVPRQ